MGIVLTGPQTGLPVIVEFKLSGIIRRAVVDCALRERNSLVVGVLTVLVDVLEFVGELQTGCIILRSHIPSSIIALIQGGDVGAVLVGDDGNIVIERSRILIDILLLLLKADIGLQLPVGTDEGGLHREGEGIRFVAIDAGVAGLWLGCQRERSLCVRSGCGDQLLVGHVKREHSTLGVTERIVDVVILGDVVGIVVLHVGQFQLGQGGEATQSVAISVFARGDVECSIVFNRAAVVCQRLCDVLRRLDGDGVACG